MNQSFTYSNSCYDGKMPVSETFQLRAGPLTLVFENGYIRSICCGKTEIVKRVYFALRDHNWNTIGGSITLEKCVVQPDSFSIAYSSVHYRNEINFSYSAEITGSKDGRITFSIRGKAHSAFKRNRIGLCTLLPIKTCKGVPCTVTSSESTITRKNFPVTIEPWQPFLDIRSMEFPFSGTMQTRLLFEGDIFEMEDQRNWTDYSFKIYSTRLSDPIPVLVDTGREIEQRVTLQVSGALCQESGAVPNHVTISIPEHSALKSRVPAIGSVIDSAYPFDNYDQLHKLSHFRYDLFFNKPAVADDYAALEQICRKSQCSVELALYFSGNSPDEFTLAESLLVSAGLPVVRFIVFNDTEAVTSAETLGRAGVIIKKQYPETPIAAGTDRYFADLNRNRPDIDACDQICYSANPQVHTFDNESIMSNLPGIAETLDTAHTFCGCNDIILSPLTLRPRKNRTNPDKAGGADERIYSIFGSAWTVAAMMYSIRSAALSVSCFYVNGPGGVFDKTNNRQSPSFLILESLARFSGAHACTVLSDNERTIAAIYAADTAGSLLLAANITDKTQKTVIRNLPSKYSVAILDKHSFDLCMRNLQNTSSQYVLELGPYAAAIIRF